MTKTIQITAKCSDMFSATLREDGECIGTYDGCVPDFMPGQHYGDYVQLTIDMDTGQVLNWRTPTKKQLHETFLKKLDILNQIIYHPDMNTILTYRLNNVTYRKVFASRVTHGSVEQFLVMEKHIGLSKVPAAIVNIENVRD